MTENEAVVLLTDTLVSIAANHLPKADTVEFWASRSMDDCFTVLAQDVQLARETLDKLGVE